MRPGAETAMADPTEDMAALLALLEGCNNPGVTRDALLIRVAEMPPDLRRPRHIRLIEAALDPLRTCDRAVQFRLPDQTLVMTWRGPALAETRSVMAGLDELFADLPQAPHEILALPRDSARLARIIAASVPVASEPATPARQSLTPGLLAQMEAALAHADVATLLRCRPVCAFDGAGIGRLAWDRQGLNVTQLAAMLAPETDIRADPWLFRRLTRSFDRRLLAAIAQPFELRNRGPFALDLSLHSVLAPEFLRFDAALPSALRGRVTVILLADDMLADPTNFVFVRDFLRARTYRIGLGEPRLAWLAAFPCAWAGVDSLYASAEPAPAAGLSLDPELTARLVLCGVTSPDQLAWGQARGISLFEGPAARPDPAARRLNLRRAAGREMRF